MTHRNDWLIVANARKIAAELQKRYCGQSYETEGRPLEDAMLADLWSHELYDESMALNIIWDDFDNVAWVQIGADCGFVPR